MASKAEYIKLSYKESIKSIQSRDKKLELVKYLQENIDRVAYLVYLNDRLIATSDKFDDMNIVFNTVARRYLP